MKNPILVYEKQTREIMIFSSLSDAQMYIEPYDISIYEVFDSEGLEIEIFVENKKEGFFGSPGNVVLRESHRYNPERLRTQILEYFKLIEIQTINQNMPLSELVKRCETI